MNNNLISIFFSLVLVAKVASEVGTTCNQRVSHQCLLPLFGPQLVQFDDIRAINLPKLALTDSYDTLQPLCQIFQQTVDCHANWYECNEGLRVFKQVTGLIRNFFEIPLRSGDGQMQRNIRYASVICDSFNGIESILKQQDQCIKRAVEISSDFFKTHQLPRLYEMLGEMPLFSEDNCIDAQELVYDFIDVILVDCIDDGEMINLIFNSIVKSFEMIPGFSNEVCQLRSTRPTLEYRIAIDTSFETSSTTTEASNQCLYGSTTNQCLFEIMETDLLRKIGKIDQFLNPLSIPNMGNGDLLETHQTCDRILATVQCANRWWKCPGIVDAFSELSNLMLPSEEQTTTTLVAKNFEFANKNCQDYQSITQNNCIRQALSLENEARLRLLGSGGQAYSQQCDDLATIQASINNNCPVEVAAKAQSVIVSSLSHRQTTLACSTGVDDSYSLV